MNCDQWQGIWRQLRGNAMKYWGRFIADGLVQMLGERERLLGVAQQQHGDLIAKQRRRGKEGLKIKSGEKAGVGTERKP